MKIELEHIGIRTTWLTNRIGLAYGVRLDPIYKPVVEKKKPIHVKIELKDER